MKAIVCVITGLRWSLNRLAWILDDRRGFSLTELLVSCSVLGMVMAAVGGVIATGSQISNDGENRAQAQQAARAGMIMEEDLRLAGSGFPPAAIKISAATPTSVSFWADLLAASSQLTANANANDTALTVADASGFRAGDVIYLINADQYSTVTVSSASGTSISLAPPGAPLAYSQGVQVGRSKLIRFAWDGVGTLLKDSGEGAGLQPLASGVTGFSLTYLDGADVVIPPGSLAANLGSIRRIVVTLTTQAGGSVDSRTFNLTSSVRPRNL